MSTALNHHDRQTARLDPLAFDADAALLPRLNGRGDLRSLRQVAAALITRAQALDPGPLLARAALRDLGFVLASLERHGVPCGSLPGAEAVLLALGARADEVPRDTVYSYAPRNPEDRTRTFTTLDEEALFITEVRRATVATDGAADDLVRAAALPLGDPELVECLTRLSDAVRTFADALLTVKRHVTPQVFSAEMRPYFPPMRVGGVLYYGPGGAQLAPLIVDVAFCRPAPGHPLEQRYTSYLKENARYLPPERRAQVDALARVPALGARLLAEHDEARREGPVGLPAEEAMRQFGGVVRHLMRFRLPHLQLARANMGVRTQGSLGSGGYQTDILDLLLGLVQELRTRLTPPEDPAEHAGQRRS